MRPARFFLYRALLASALLLAGAAASAQTPAPAPAPSPSPATGVQGCEALRADIQARIAAAGVARFTVTTVDANANVPGRVVGSCERGSKKIVYEQQGAPGGSGAAPPASALGGASPAKAATPPTRERILTECRDGTVSMGGYCKP